MKRKDADHLILDVVKRTAVAGLPLRFSQVEISEIPLIGTLGKVKILRHPGRPRAEMRGPPGRKGSSTQVLSPARVSRGPEPLLSCGGWGAPCRLDYHSTLPGFPNKKGPRDEEVFAFHSSQSFKLSLEIHSQRVVRKRSFTFGLPQSARITVFLAEQATRTPGYQGTKGGRGGRVSNADLLSSHFRNPPGVHYSLTRPPLTGSQFKCLLAEQRDES